MFFAVFTPSTPAFLRLHSPVAPAETLSFLAFLARRLSPTSGLKPLPRRPSGADNLPMRDSTAMARSQERARLFQQPNSPPQRRYEICHAYFHEGSTADELAERFHLHVGTVRAIVRDL